MEQLFCWAGVTAIGPSETRTIRQGVERFTRGKDLNGKESELNHFADGSFKRVCLHTTAVLLGVIAPLITIPSSGVGATAPTEFAGITRGCISPGSPDIGSPVWYITLYNLPGNASPTVSGTMSIGDFTVPLNNNGEQPRPVQGQPGTWSLSNGFEANPPAAVLFSINWTDGAGGDGSHRQIVGIPNCNLRVSQRSSAIASTQEAPAYWTVTSEGQVNGFIPSNTGGAANLYGDMANLLLNAPIVGMAALPASQGYWLLGGDGGVFSFGLAQFYGSTGGMQLNAPVVGMAVTPDGGGYWLVAKDGGIFAYGDAVFYGSMGGKPLNRPIVGMAVDQATGGYWLVASDGGIFSFNAPFHGSTGNLVLNQPIVGMESAPDGSGYRLAASDGGVFSFNLPFEGGNAGHDPNPMVGIAGNESSTGYWLLDSCGAVYPFGSAPFLNGVIVC